MKVELLYDTACPHVDRARENLRRAFAAAGVPPRWREWRRDDPAAPPGARGYGSPTILVEDEDVTGAKPGADADCCRLYAPDESGSRGAPSVEVIAAALERHLQGAKMRPLVPMPGSAGKE